jgi:hypothetical protein
MVHPIYWLHYWIVESVEFEYWSRVVDCRVKRSSLGYWIIGFDLIYMPDDFGSPEQKTIRHSEDDYLTCFISEKKWMGECTDANLSLAIQLLQDWAKPLDADLSGLEASYFANQYAPAFERFTQRTLKSCQTEGYEFEIATFTEPGWRVMVSLETDRGWNGHDFVPCHLQRFEHDWITLSIDENKLMGNCGPYNLGELLELVSDTLSLPNLSG